MKNYLFYLLAFISISLFCSCGSVIYGPGITGNSMPYQARSAYHGEKVSKTWVTGSIHNGYTYGGIEERNQLFMGSIHRAQTGKHFKATFGGFLFGGIYDQVNIQNLNFYGIGARASMAGVIPTRKWDINIIGLQGGFAKEFGNYHQQVGDISEAITLNFTTGMDHKLNDKSSVGVELGIGTTGAPLSIHYTNQRFSLWTQMNLATFSDEDGIDNNRVFSIGGGIRL